ncbi:single-stranded DNA-binding protein [Acetobacter musti]|uniref:single-stranded DNA-binding protein n=1 Tax=Acetobacter musti TaxID=864732 RepID=UPI0030D2C6F4
MCFNDHLSGVIECRCQKGTLVYVEGHLETRKWTDQQAQNRYKSRCSLRIGKRHAHRASPAPVPREHHRSHRTPRRASRR